MTDKQDKKNHSPKENEHSTDSMNDLENTSEKETETPIHSEMDEPSFSEVDERDDHENETADEKVIVSPSDSDTSNTQSEVPGDDLDGVPSVETAEEEQEEAREDDGGKETLTPFERFLRGFDLFYEVSKRVLFVLVILLVIGIALVGGAGAGFFASLVEGKEIPPFEEMESEITDVTVSSRMYYAGGELISDLRSDLKRTPVPLENISPYIIDALIATEDEYFYEHQGIVPKAIGRALYQEFSGSTITSGGSTLTQQLVKQQILTNEVSFERKANEILLALRLENAMSKDEILEAYLNVSPFGRNNQGNNIAGVQEAAQGIFGVPASDVTLPQAAFIAGLPQSPIAYAPYNQYGQIKENLDAGISRQKDVLYRMFREEYITRDEYEEAINYDITQDFISTAEEDSLREDQSFAYDAVEKAARDILIEQLYTEDGRTAEEISADETLYQEYYEEADSLLRYSGYKIHSTIDRDLHEGLEQVALENREQLGREKTVSWYDEETEETYSRTKPVENSSVTLDNKTGRIIAFVGGIDYSSSQVNLALDTRRQPGSVIKPLVVYGPGLDAGIITPASISPDTEYSVPSYENGRMVDHQITNAGPITNEWFSAREALARSQNIPTAKFYEAVRNRINPIEYLRKMGWGNAAIDEQYDTGPSVALGGLTRGPTNLELTSAFATIANGGVHVEPYLIDRIEDQNGEVIYQHEVKETRVFSPQTAFLLQDILRDVMTDGTARGTKEALNFNADIISKTGTTNDTIDIWYVASTPQVTVSSWMGYNNIMVRSGLDWDFGISPSRRNRMQWARLMNKINELNPTLLGKDQRFQAPSGITQESVLAQTGMKPGRVEGPDDQTFNASGSTINEYFNEEFVPKTTTYDFAFGATDEELAKFWGQSSSDDEDDDEEDNDDDEKKQEEESGGDSSNGDSNNNDSNNEDDPSDNNSSDSTENDDRSNEDRGNNNENSNGNDEADNSDNAGNNNGNANGNSGNSEDDEASSSSSSASNTGNSSSASSSSSKDTSGSSQSSSSSSSD